MPFHVQVLFCSILAQFWKNRGVEGACPDLMKIIILLWTLSIPRSSVSIFGNLSFRVSVWLYRCIRFSRKLTGKKYRTASDSIFDPTQGYWALPSLHEEASMRSSVRQANFLGQTMHVHLVQLANTRSTAHLRVPIVLQEHSLTALELPTSALLAWQGRTLR